jgi:hypothetical protein
VGRRPLSRGLVGLLGEFGPEIRRVFGGFPACSKLSFQVFRFSGFQVFRFSGFQVFRFSGFQVFRFSGFQALRP